MRRKMFAFVYGTLKRGEANHHWLSGTENGSATFVATGVTQNIYPLVIASRYNIPFLVDQKGTGKNIQGEIYQIDEKMLAHLDILEEYPKLYTRREEPILISEDSTDNGKLINAWTYFLSDYRPALLNLPYLDCYSSNGPHNLPYVASEDDLADANDI